MHADEVDVDEALVRALLREQLPELAPEDGRPLRRVLALGTDHAIYRLGDDLSVRLPRIGWADGQGEREHAWLPRLAPALPAAVPEPVALGVPGHGYPFRWYVAPWLPGERPAVDDPLQQSRLATDLAAFVTALQSCDATGAPTVRPGRRGAPLVHADGPTVDAAERLRGTVDPATGEEVELDALLAIWHDGVRAPGWDGAPVWVHGDLSDGNLVVQDRRLTGVIDWSALAAGDPAVELMCAWSTLDGPARSTLRTLLRPDDATWARGRAWATSAALQALPYYRDTNPDIVERSWRTVRAVLADPG
jgi:aminoglycoside phosphotransferase (APT) family kinase protein